MVVARNGNKWWFKSGLWNSNPCQKSAKNGWRTHSRQKMRILSFDCPERIYFQVCLNPRNEIIFKNQAVSEIVINIDTVTVALTQTWMLLLYSNPYVRSGPHWLWRFVLLLSLVWWQRMFFQHRFMVSKGKKLFFCGTTCLTTLRERGHSTSIWYPRWVLENDHTVPC